MEKSTVVNVTHMTVALFFFPWLGWITFTGKFTNDIHLNLKIRLSFFMNCILMRVPSSLISCQNSNVVNSTLVRVSGKLRTFTDKNFCQKSEG